jgi:flagellar motor switch protein FliM
MSLMSRIPSSVLAAPVDTPGDLRETREVRPFALGTGDVTGLADFYGLRAIHERFGRIARQAFVPMLRFQPRITSHPPELVSFDEFRRTLGNPVALTVWQMEELRGNQLMVMPHQLVSVLTNAFYGGGPVATPATQAEFSGTEQRVIELVTDRLMQAMQVAWRDVMPVSMSLAAREESTLFATFADGDEMVVDCRFTVQLPGGESARIDVVYPMQLLRPISSLLRSRLQSDQLDEDRSWRERLEQAVMGVPLSVSVRLCQPELPLNRIVALSAGDVLPVALTGTVDVLVAGRVLFQAQPGEQGGRAAVCILRQQTG